MITLNGLLIGIVAGAITFKVVLLAIAAVLVAHGLMAGLRQQTVTPVRAPVPVPRRKTTRQRKLDVYV